MDERDIVISSKCGIQNILDSTLRKGIKNYDFLEKKLESSLHWRENQKIKKSDLRDL